MRKARSEATKQFYSAIGERISIVRRSRKMSQETLARAIGLTRTTVVNIESGKQQLLLHTFVEIARALAIEPRELIPARPVSNLALPDALAVLVPKDNVRTWVAQTIHQAKTKNRRKAHSP